MKSLRAKTGPFKERPYLDLAEIDRMCVEELKRADLYPFMPSAIRIDRFIEKRFGIAHSYEELPEGVLGFTRFGPNGVEEVIVARSLDDEVDDATRRRLRATLAHEAGHGLLHTYLFVVGEPTKSLFGEEATGEPKILCREVAGVSTDTNYDGRWWEYQANRAIGGLLLPRPLVFQALERLLDVNGGLAIPMLSDAKASDAIKLLTSLFDVNPAVSKIRIAELLPTGGRGQLSL